MILVTQTKGRPKNKIETENDIATVDTETTTNRVQMTGLTNLAPIQQGFWFGLVWLCCPTTETIDLETGDVFV